MTHTDGTSMLSVCEENPVEQAVTMREKRGAGE
jgi:hypothetical protein